MFVLYLGFAGLLAFAVGAGVLGVWLRKNPSKENAERSSRVMHFLFFAGIIAPGTVLLFYPGLAHLDELAGIAPLPWKPFFLVTGILLGLPGFYFLGVSNKLLRALGSGANAFRLTQQVVATDVYQRTRNPMSLGYYLGAVALGFVFGSRLLTLAIVFGLIPAHLFFLKFFEELELELRFGKAYKEYKEKVPFLFPKFSKE